MNRGLVFGLLGKVFLHSGLLILLSKSRGTM